MAYRVLATHMTLQDKIDRLCKLSQPVVNDERQDKYCEYITRFCSHYKHGDTQEGCKVVGSTREGIRLRLEKDEGDFDYLAYSWIRIPGEALEFRKDLPCFCHIKAGSVVEKFGGDIKLIDDIYLPSSVLRNVNKTAFPLLKGLLDIVSSFESTHGRHTLHLSLKQDIKPGVSKVIYNGWECEELQNIPIQRKGDPDKILKLLQNALLQSPELSLTLGPIVSLCGLIGSLKQSAGDDTDALIYQNVGPLMEAFGRYKTPDKDQRHEQNDEGRVRTFKHPKSEVSDRCENECTTPITQKKVLIRFQSKASKDFIPSFMLTSPPECIIKWCNKTHKWPPKDVVENIRHCRYYVVAKPAIQNEDPDRDFCLGCNEAEMLLADAMLPIQRKSMLVIKAFLKGVLIKFSDYITTFHWKTALYRVSEEKDDFQTNTFNTQFPDDSPENVVKFVQEVMEYMTKSICERNLQHFFCESNLFAGLSDDVAEKFTDRLIYLHDHIEISLERFLLESEKKGVKIEEIDGTKIIMATKTLLDDTNKTEVEGILTIMSGITEMTDDDDDDKLKEAILDVFLHALPYIKEEMERGKDSASSNRENPSTSAKTKSKQNEEVDDCVISLLRATSGRERRRAQDKLFQNIMSGLLKK